MIASSALTVFGRKSSPNQNWVQLLTVACMVALVFCMFAPSAEAKTKKQGTFTPRAAALVVDAYSGRVLYSQNADVQCYPASLTKVMTLYLLFEKLHQGKVTLNSRIPVSAHAAAQAPSRLGVKPGTTIRVEDAILALVTKSANDIAVAVGESIGGTEKNFATLMTAKAQALGMSRTRYMNASGLPNKGQLTTARDMATLAKRIQVDFPQYYHYFGTEEFTWDGHAIRNHNHLLGKYEGVNGLKTGYTAASGFNLTASVWRDGKSLIGVVMGGRTAKARDLEMVSILDRAMPSAMAKRDTGTRLASAAPTPKPSAAPSSISDRDRNALTSLAANDEPDPDEESYTGTDKVASLTASPAPTVAAVTPPTAHLKAAPVNPAPATPVAAATPVSVAAAPIAAAPIPATVAAATRTAPLRVASLDTSAAAQRSSAVQTVVPALRPANAAAATPPAVAAASTSKSLAAARQPAAPLDNATAYALAAFNKAEGPVRRVSRDLGSLIVSPAQASEGSQAAQHVGMRTAVNESQRPVTAHGWLVGDPLIPEGSWVIQIGAYADQADAVDRIRHAIKAAPTELGKAVPVTIPVKTADNRTIYRSRFGGFGGEKEARDACGRLARESISCIAIPPANWPIPQNASAREKAPG